MKKSWPKAEPNMQPIIIGGGWSGLAAAVRLCEAGQRPIVFEAANHLGGRARSVKWNDINIDNGQHLMIGAYHNMLDLIDRLQLDQRQLFARQPLDFIIDDPHYPPLTLSARSSLPWPFALLPSVYKSLGWRDTYRFIRLAMQLKTTSRRSNLSVMQWCEQSRQSHRLIEQLWKPLCLAILNTPLEQASARVFAQTLQDSLAADRQAADLLIPQKPLGEIIAEPAGQFILAHGGDVRRRNRVKKICITDGSVTGVISQSGETTLTNQVIVAVTPNALQTLLGDVLSCAPVMEYPITTVYLQFSADYRLPALMLGASNRLTQWVFDRSDLSPGLLAVVISGQGSHEAFSKQQLAEALVDELTDMLGTSPGKLHSSQVIREKRATFCCGVVENDQRPSTKTQIEGLYLAGDFVANAYPATLEGAIINGYRAAEDLLAAVF